MGGLRGLNLTTQQYYRYCHEQTFMSVRQCTQQRLCATLPLMVPMIVAALKHLLSARASYRHTLRRAGTMATKTISEDGGSLQFPALARQLQGGDELAFDQIAGPHANRFDNPPRTIKTRLQYGTRLMAQSGVIAGPQFAGSSRCREYSLMFIRTMNRNKRAGASPGSVIAF